MEGRQGHAQHCLAHALHRAAWGRHGDILRDGGVDDGKRECDSRRACGSTHAVWRCIFEAVLSLACVLHAHARVREGVPRSGALTDSTVAVVVGAERRACVRIVWLCGNGRWRCCSSGGGRARAIGPRSSPPHWRMRIMSVNIYSVHKQRRFGRAGERCRTVGEAKGTTGADSTLRFQLPRCDHSFVRYGG